MVMRMGQSICTLTAIMAGKKNLGMITFTNEYHLGHTSRP